MELLSGYLEIPSNCIIKCHSWDLELTCSIHWASFVPNKWVCRNVKYGPEWQPVWLYHHIALITIWHTSLIASNQPPLPPLNPLHISAIFFPGIHKCVVSSGYVTLGNVPYSALFPAFFFSIMVPAGNYLFFLHLVQLLSALLVLLCTSKYHSKPCYYIYYK